MVHRKINLKKIEYVVYCNDVFIPLAVFIKDESRDAAPEK